MVENDQEWKGQSFRLAVSKALDYTDPSDQSVCEWRWGDFFVARGRELVLIITVEDLCICVLTRRRSTH